MKRFYCLAVVILCLASHALAQADAGAGAAAAAEKAPAPVGAADFSARLDAHRATRDASESIKQQDLAIAEGLKAFPNDYGLLWRAARHKWFVADGLQGDQKKAVAKEAWAYADRALKVKPGALEGHYFKAISIGAYSEAVGILTALSEGLEGQFVDNLDVALKLNEGFDRAGPVRAKGRYYAQLPWPKRDRQKAVELLTRAIKLSPEATRSHLYLADVLLHAGEEEAAQAEMKKLLSMGVDFDPPEGRRVLIMAKPLAAQIEAELK